MVDFEISFHKTFKEEGGLSDNPNDLGGLTIMGVCYRDWNESKPQLFSILKNYMRISELDRMYKLPKNNDKQIQTRKELIKESKALVYNMCMGNYEFMNLIKEVYKTYWDNMNLDLLANQNDANTIFDFGFNAGSNRAVRYTQRIVKVKEDGIMGRVTANAINNIDNFTNRYNDARKEYYTKISKKGNQSVFLAGWLKRVSKFYV